MSGQDVMVAAIIFGSVTITIVTLTKTWIRHIESRDRARLGGGADEARLLRMEQAIDAVAVEVERMSESQRFLTKLLAERLPGAQASPSSLPRGE